MERSSKPAPRNTDVGQRLLVPVIEGRAKKTFTPLADQVVVQVIKLKAADNAPIILPDGQLSNDWVTPTGWVIAVGKDVKEVRPGQKVLFGTGTPACKVRFGGEPELLAVREVDILGIANDSITSEVSAPVAE